MTASDYKQQVHDFWNDSSCGENLYLPGSDRRAYDLQYKARYELEPYIVEFAGFDAVEGKRLLEIGVGLGADHQRFAEMGADLYGIDLTERAIEHTARRLAAYDLRSKLAVGDAECLEFPDDYFDRVYSWGVLHHTPNTDRAILEVHRVLKPGGMATVMIYHKWSIVGLALWIRYALLRFQPWISLNAIYGRYLESPGTKAYTISEAMTLFSAFQEVRIRTVLTHGDLLESSVGQRHGGFVLTVARRLMPRSLIRRFFPQLGLFMLITARK